MNITSTPPLPSSRVRCHVLQGVKGFLLFHSPKYFPYPSAHSILGNPGHPLYPQTKRRHDEKDRNTLWWIAYGVKSQIPKAVVRFWGERRLKQAFRLALRDRGFDVEGRRIIGPQQRPGASGGHPALKGTVRLQVLKPLVTMSGADVRDEARLAVDRIVQLCSDSDSATITTTSTRARMNWRSR